LDKNKQELKPHHKHLKNISFIHVYMYTFTTLLKYVHVTLVWKALVHACRLIEAQNKD